MKNKSTFWMRYKLMTVSAFESKEIKAHEKLLIALAGWLFVFAEPDSTFLPKYYERFPGEKK